MMRPVLRLCKPTFRECGDDIGISAKILMDDRLFNTLWFQIPLKHAELVTDSIDPFLVAIIPLAMKTSSKLIVEGDVSKSLLRNVEEFQAAWQAWLPNELHTVPMQVEDEVPDPESAPARQGVAVAFSGGVDSCFSVYRHSQGFAGRRSRQIRSGIMVHGFDVPLDQPDAFRAAAGRAEVMLDSLNISLVPVATNYREVMDPHVKWEHHFANGIAAALSLFRESHEAAMIAASYAYDVLSFPYGSNPVTDPLLGSDSFPVIHDGAESGRYGKLKLISSWHEAMENLRVCWNGPAVEYNCCRCEKCIRNILSFRILGVPQPPCFPLDVSDKQIRSLKLKGTAVNTFEFLLWAARSHHAEGEWVAAVEQVLRRARFRAFYHRLLRKK